MNIKKAYKLNLILLIVEIFSLSWMMSGIKVVATTNTLMAARLEMFKYFTVDSNFLIAIAALVMLIEQNRIIKNKKKEISNIAYIFKLMSTVGITLTMLVTLTFLAPTMGLGVVFAESNLFLHVINPILSILVFLLYEKTSKISFRHTFTACIPLVLYSIYYVYLAITHIENGKVLPGYDWYGFFFLGIKSVIIILPIILTVTYLISYLLWKYNKERKTK